MNFGKNGRSHPCGNFAHRAANSGSSSGANREACGATGSATTSAIAGTYRPRPGKTKVKVKSAARQAWSRFTLHACSRASARHGSPPAIRNRAQPAKRPPPPHKIGRAPLRKKVVPDGETSVDALYVKKK